MVQSINLLSLRCSHKPPDSRMYFQYENTMNICIYVGTTETTALSSPPEMSPFSPFMCSFLVRFIKADDQYIFTLYIYLRYTHNNIQINILIFFRNERANDYSELRLFSLTHRKTICFDIT